MVQTTAMNKHCILFEYTQFYSSVERETPQAHRIFNSRARGYVHFVRESYEDQGVRLPRQRA